MNYKLYHCRVIGNNSIVEKVTTIEASNLNEAFRLSQNDFNPDYAKLGLRSTCVGDIFVKENGERYEVTGMGFNWYGF